MKKFLLSSVVIFSFASYALSQRVTSSEYVAQPSLHNTVSNTPTNKQPVKISSAPPPQKHKVVLRRGDGETEDSFEGDDSSEDAGGVASLPSSSQPTPPAPAPAPMPMSMPMAMGRNMGMYKNGTYTGSVADAYYGNVQVNAIVQNGKLADVQFLDYPQDRGTSRMINSQAMPLLTREAVQAQNAQVDIVSGATATSEAFMQSLAVALAAAKS